MEEKSIIERHKVWFIFTGLVSSGCMLLFLLAVFICPLASYNPTRLDATKISLRFNDFLETDADLVWGVLISIISFIPQMINRIFIQKGSWKRKTTMMIVISAIGVLIFAIGMGIIFSDLISYDVPGTNNTFYLDLEIGSYLVWLSMASVIISLIEAIGLKRIQTGKIPENKFFGKN